MDSFAVDAWGTLQAHFFEVHAMFYSPELLARWQALEGMLRGLGVLLSELNVAYQCPMSCTRHFRQASEWALALGHPMRARGLVQMGNIFKLQAMARWWNEVGSKQPEGAPLQRHEPRLQVEYTLAVTQLHNALQVPMSPIRRFSGPASPRIEIHSICTYKPDPTSNTGPECPLPGLSVPNHRAFAELHGHNYVLHTEVPLPDREAHYSKMLVVHQALMRSDAPDWVFFIDCDAFFTNPDVALADILETYGASRGEEGPHFLVAEDPGGVNTGTLFFRRSAWTISFLERVANSQFGIAWDQSMFFWEMLRTGLLELFVPPGLDVPADFQFPREVALVHQAHLNAFVPPASRDWSAYEWQPGDVVRHFAGCPWQEEHCLRLMHETAEYASGRFNSR